MATEFPSLEGLSAEDITRLAVVAQQALTNPKTRTQAQRMVKTLDPAASFPELDIDDRIEANNQKMLAEFDRRDKAEAARRAQEDRTRSLDMLALEGGLSRDDVTINPEKKLAPIEQFMLDNRIGDYNSAARLYKMSQAPADAQSSAFMPSIASAPELPTMDLGGKSLKQWAYDSAFQTSADLKSGKLKVDAMGYPIK